MPLISLVLYGVVNVVMVCNYLARNGGVCHFPFWAGVLALGWFFPQAIGGYVNVSKYPVNAYEDAMLFATLCTVALWFGYGLSLQREPRRASWLDASFDVTKLYYAGAALCLLGFFFQWKLWSLPEEMLNAGIWSGATVKYLFLASVFKIGFLALWLIYLRQRKILSAKLLVFIVPSLLMLLDAVVLRGRRAEMMNLAAYILVCLWFVRRVSVPRWVIVSGLIAGLILINSIGLYRSIMSRKDESIKERMHEAVTADYLSSSLSVIDESGFEFRNYLFYRQTCAVYGIFDYGGWHWNKFVFNFVPAQLVGREFKQSLKLKNISIESPRKEAKELYGYSWQPGSTSTGYLDPFASFGWFGFVKFFVVGAIMGILYRHAMQGAFLGQLIYVYVLNTAMHAVSHDTNGILIRIWVYFFAMGYPVLYLAKVRRAHDLDVSISTPLSDPASE